MILDNVNPDDLFPTEKKGPSVLGIIEYNVQRQSEFEGAFIATNERLIMNVDMNGQFYYRNIRYDEVNQVEFDGKDIMFEFNIGKVPMKQIKTEDVQAFVDYVKQKIQ
ncbi:PH domain-containing protein [Staphylococcus capitis]|uniref:PH domain-containing protein n=1 Tax=Staphylococcus capitis TaxID=29388 RepID=UPI001888FAC3|nr:PH domain-containing protein [Staphylococcus capitis]MBF2262171.1 PH domain-containing protein [Staphylococcus capitis]MBF2282085.1 PH domain-containing protein [Staphylococcus capitis]